MQRIMNPVEETDRIAEVETNMAQPQRSSRRDFLRGKAATEALREAATDIAGQAGEAPGGLSYGASDREAGYLLRFGRRAMACEFEVLLNAGQYPQGPEAALAALDLVDELEAQLTVYRDDSEVSQINRSADLREVEIEPRLFALFSLAARMHRETGGAYDITSGPLSKTWGFYRREGRVPGDAELAAAREHVGLQHVELNSQRSTIRFRKSGMEINLGSIGKGYALDRIAELFASKGIENFLLHGGNSSVLGRGTCADGWWIGLRHPLVPERRIGEVLLRNRRWALLEAARSFSCTTADATGTSSTRARGGRRKECYRSPWPLRPAPRPMRWPRRSTCSASMLRSNIAANTPASQQS